MGRKWFGWALCCALLIGPACARSRSSLPPDNGSVADPDDEARDDSDEQDDADESDDDRGATGEAMGAGNDPGAIAGAGGTSNPSAMSGDGQGTPPGGSDDPGDIDPPGQSDDPPSGGPMPGEELPPGSRPPEAIDVLNPQRCATDQPFVLSIDPGGASGHVQGWLESAPTVEFDRYNLPRFSAESADQESLDGELLLWWSINTLSDDGTSALYFYAGNEATEVAMTPARSVEEIGDASALAYEQWAVGPVPVGGMVVFHHVPNDRYVAVRVDKIYGPGDSGAFMSNCAAVDARWQFAPAGSADF